MLPNLASTQSRPPPSHLRRARLSLQSGPTCESSDLLVCVREVLRDCCRSRVWLNPGTPAMQGAAGLLRNPVSAQSGHTFVGCPGIVAKWGFVAIQVHPLKGVSRLLRNPVSSQSWHTCVGCPWIVAKWGFVAIQAHLSPMCAEGAFRCNQGTPASPVICWRACTRCCGIVVKVGFGSIQAHPPCRVQRDCCETLFWRNQDTPSWGVLGLWQNGALSQPRCTP